MKKSTGETALQQLIANMEPILNDGNYVFATVTDLTCVPRELTVCEMREKEGATVVLAQEDADALGLPYAYIAAWITLNVHSALEAVGLTAAFAAALGANNISCNVIAGYYHDHIFVDAKDKISAMEVLHKLAKDGKRGN